LQIFQCNRIQGWSPSAIGVIADTSSRRQCITYMNNPSNKEEGFSSGIKSSNKRCFRCNGLIYFTSKEAETPSGKPTKDSLTGKVIPLDPFTQDYHICRPEDISTYRETDEYKERIAGWKSTQQQKNLESISNTIQDSNTVSSTYKDDNNNNSTNLTLDKILTGIDHIRSELADIKNSLKIATDISSSQDE
jgi:hypothetical protein